MSEFVKLSSKIRSEVLDELRRLRGPPPASITEILDDALAYTIESRGCARGSRC